MNGLIYKAESPSGKIYIGQTVNFSKRLKEHKRTSEKENQKEYNIKFHQALRKYGFESFKWEILENDIPRHLLNEKEVQFIIKFNSYKNGYNSTLGGDSNPMENEESRKKISEKMKLNNPVKNLEVRKKIAETLKIRTNLNCINCNKSFYPNRDKRKFCSNFCYNLYKSDNPKLYKESDKRKARKGDLNPMSFISITFRYNCSLGDAKIIRKKIINKELI